MSYKIYPKYKGGDVSTGGFFISLANAGMFLGQSDPVTGQYPFQLNADMFFKKKYVSGEWVDWDAEGSETEFPIQVAIDGVNWLTTPGMYTGSGFRVYVSPSHSIYPWIIPDRVDFPTKVVVLNVRGGWAEAGQAPTNWSDAWANTRVLALPVLPETNLKISHINKSIRAHTTRSGDPSHDHSLGSLSTKDEYSDAEFNVDNKINKFSPFRPDGISTHDKSEWRNYCPYARGGINMGIAMFGPDGQYVNDPSGVVDIDDGEYATIEIIGNKMWEQKYAWSTTRLTLYTGEGTPMEYSTKDFTSWDWQTHRKEFPWIGGFEGQTITYQVAVEYWWSDAWVKDESSIREFRIAYGATPVKVQIKDADGEPTWPRRENTTGSWVRIKFMLKNQTGSARAFDCRFRTYENTSGWVNKELTTNIVQDGQSVEVTITDDTIGYFWDAIRDPRNWELYVKHPDDEWYLKGFSGMFFTEEGYTPGS